MKTFRLVMAACAMCLGLSSLFAAEPAETARPFRPPAVPLVACDPYFSIWSPADRLTDAPTCHWTGRIQWLTSMIRVDDKAYRLMAPEPKEVPAMTQVGSPLVLPTRTIYSFKSAEVEVQVTFMNTALPDNPAELSRPVTYLTWTVTSRDGKEHDVVLYYDNSAELVVNALDQEVVWERLKRGSLNVLKMGSKDQPILAKKGDNLRIDWGYLYVAAPDDKSVRGAIVSDKLARGNFAEGKPLPDADDARMPRAARDEWPVAAFTLDLGKVGEQTVSRHIILAYDDIYSIEYLGTRLRAYWRRPGSDGLGLVQDAEMSYSSLEKRCARFDAELMRDLI
jgi:hypothetical protein